MKFTIFGGSGFIGSNLAKYLKEKGHEVFLPIRDGSNAIDRDLGNVVYAVGLTGDFRSKPFETIEAHVCLLSHLLQHTKFDSWLYLSSTRGYGGLSDSCYANEDVKIPFYPSSDSLYDISKLLGESLCLSQQSSKIRIARLSNVYGAGQSEHTFLAAVLGELREKGQVTIRESPSSTKDYISLSDVLVLLEQIALFGQDRIYNVASGISLSHQDLANHLSQLTNCTIQFGEQAAIRKFPQIDVSRIMNEFLYTPMTLQEYLSEIFKTKAIKGNNR